LIHQLKSEQNEIYVWLMLQNEFNQIEQNLLCGLATIDELPSDFAKYIVIQSPILSLDHTLASLIEGGSKLRGHYFDFLVLRQSLTVGLIKRWLKAEQISNESGHCALARQNVAEGIEWINANGYGEQYLFERLLTKYDRGTWFRQYFGTEQNSIAHDNVATFAKLLELKEFSAFDVTLTDAPFHFSLSGDSKLASVVLDYLSDLDEFEGEIWIKALYVVYGATLPVSPAQVGIELNWQEILELLKKWREMEGHIQKLPSRLGYELTFESSISAMMDRNIDAQFRGWIWKQICLYSRSYIQWDEMMPIHQQEWNIERLKSAPSAAERFNLRGNHAVVGY
jgi:hypothetical protein